MDNCSGGGTRVELTGYITWPRVRRRWSSRTGRQGHGDRDNESDARREFHNPLGFRIRFFKKGKENELLSKTMGWNVLIFSGS